MSPFFLLLKIYFITLQIILKIKYMEAKLIELKPTKNYIDKNHLDLPMHDKVLTSFILDMVNRKNKSDSYKS